MTFTVSFTSPYPTTTVKILLEEHLLIPRKIRHFLRTKKHLSLNGQTVNWQSPVVTGDRIDMIFDDDDYPKKEIPWGQAELVDCLYEDEHLIIVNKPEGMKTHANQPNEIALLNHVSAYTKQTCYVIHRLDKETSGLILFAKNPFILPLMNRLLEERRIQRRYWAIIEGSISPKEVIYTEKIGRHRHDRRKRVIDQLHGQKAYTKVTALKDYGKHSLVNCQLKTGRTHQIRVHLAYHGHAILGDPLYQTNPTQQRLMLHAHELSFTQPLTLEKITVKATSKTFEKECSMLLSRDNNSRCHPRSHY